MLKCPACKTGNLFVVFRDDHGAQHACSGCPAEVLKPADGGPLQVRTLDDMLADLRSGL